MTINSQYKGKDLQMKTKSRIKNIKLEKNKQ